MKTIQSSLRGIQGTFGQIRDSLAQDDFTLANWEYDGGYFDRKLDEHGQGMVFLRLPFDVMHGRLDDTDARIEFGTPFVLKHVYETGLDDDIGYATGPLVAPVANQFQEPVDKDAGVDERWVRQAGEILRLVEKRFA